MQFLLLLISIIQIAVATSPAGTLADWKWTLPDYTTKLQLPFRFASVPHSPGYTVQAQWSLNSPSVRGTFHLRVNGQSAPSDLALTLAFPDDEDIEILSPNCIRSTQNSATCTAGYLALHQHSVAVFTVEHESSNEWAAYVQSAANGAPTVLARFRIRRGSGSAVMPIGYAAVSYTENIGRCKAMERLAIDVYTPNNKGTLEGFIAEQNQQCAGQNGYELLQNTDVDDRYAKVNFGFIDGPTQVL